MTNSSIATADLYDQHRDKLLVCDTQFRQFGGVRAFAGPVVTLLSYEDNMLMKLAISEPGKGRVLVVDTQASLRVAMLGDNMARRAADNGWAGLIINGAVRDASALTNIAIGVKALGTNPRRSLKLGVGERDVPVTFGGMAFFPGADLVSDDDGVVTLPRG